MSYKPPACRRLLSYISVLNFSVLVLPTEKRRREKYGSMISQTIHYGRNDDQGAFLYAQSLPRLFLAPLRLRPQTPPATINPPAITPRMTARFDGRRGRGCAYSTSG